MRNPHIGRGRGALRAPAVRLPLVAATLLGATACTDLPLAPDAALELTPSFALVGTAFDDGFAVFDASRWSRSSHWLGRGPLLPGNVALAGDSVRLNVHAQSPSPGGAPYQGAEMRTHELYGTGTFTLRGRCAVPAGAICAFFFYEIGVGDAADEIDIEIMGGARTIWFTTWQRGRRTNTHTATLPFDPSLGMHSYTIVRASNELRFLVDGVQLARFRKKLPQAAMPVFANAWWPTWLTPVNASGAWVIDHVSAF